MLDRQNVNCNGKYYIDEPVQGESVQGETIEGET